MNHLQRLTTPGRALLTALLLLANSLATAGEVTLYYHLDALGSPVAATDEQGNVKWREEYKPYGERINQEATAQANRRWYTGHPHDEATGLTYMGARYYDPVVGRFMATDPVAFTEKNIHSFNRYGYANNNPYSYLDPDGEWAVPLIIGGLWFIYESTRSVTLDEYGDAPLADVSTMPGPIGPVGRGVKVTREIGGAAEDTGRALKDIDPKALIGRQGRDEMSSNKIKRLAKDMKEIGFDPNEPVDVANVGGKRIILDGHHRVEAAKRAGVKKIPIREHTVTSEQADQLLKEASESRLR